MQYKLVYNCTGCGSSCGVLNAANGTLSDGSNAALYTNSANCEWMIAPPGALQVTIRFTSVSTQTRTDVVRVFQCSDLACLQPQLLAELFGFHFMAQTITSTSGFMKVAFTTDSSVNYDGFNATWTSVGFFCVYYADVVSRWRPKCCLGYISV
jgi:hypothetical protein